MPEYKHDSKPPRRRGAPPGNQNARTHGFYSQSLTQSQRLSLRKTSNDSGLDEQIDQLRLKMKVIADLYPDNLTLINQTINSLTRLIRTAAYLAQRDEQIQQLRRVLENIYRDAFPQSFPNDPPDSNVSDSPISGTTQ